MLLETITGPADLRDLDQSQLEQLAGEIRAFIVQSVWVTGHQAYVHKILTGRRDRFSKLRQANGLSGYPSRAESPHDWVENSHASTILGYAHGLAMAMDLKHESDRRVVAVIGDGSMTGG